MAHCPKICSRGRDKVTVTNRQFTSPCNCSAICLIFLTVVNTAFMFPMHLGASYNTCLISNQTNPLWHDDVTKWKHFQRYWPFVRGIHRSPVNSPHKGQWRGALMFSLICVWINAWVNNRETGDLRRYRAHYDVIVMDNCEVWTNNLLITVP